MNGNDKVSEKGEKVKGGEERGRLEKEIQENGKGAKTRNVMYYKDDEHEENAEVEEEDGVD